MRQQARGEIGGAIEAISPHIKKGLDQGDAAHRRLDEVERDLDRLRPIAQTFLGFRSRSFLGRFKWLLLGR